MLPEVTYADYRAYGGRLSEEDFSSSLSYAKSRVKEIIGFNEVEFDFQVKPYVNAVCAALEVDTQYGGSHGVGEGLASVSIGSFSASLGSSESVSGAYEADITRAIIRELSGSGLLYQGIA